ncbi:similar to Saccharomyces cerevisiae YBR230C OM14 Integral mitochondrial outer membrane protein [Maudiozyma saulgeensis]|uniref:Similar to Saccharomyces cerevisiae YBR230C OM14 Integral mitochondrial outer membrane protein n=1 Tax=Maudiozyma saulgeensis TaxID=1789683 RepID=A0A1X7R116_9SACH|nr:similar to Saccharomyces cerevisiae YBR230C OM14 Integral mitochondrial outer membrane protein [Kazachstania saulgeensis]
MSTPNSKKQEEPVVVDSTNSCNENNKCEKCAKCLENFKNKCYCTTSACFQKVIGCGNNILVALKNPVVAINVLIGAASITSVLLGYIKYEKRFLADKPDMFIVGSVVGIAGLLTADCFLSKKYYKKFDKSK